jgi:hypothetical protein
VDWRIQWCAKTTKVLKAAPLISGGAVLSVFFQLLPE